MYKMQAGMGDVIFAPLYKVLRRRGVKFKFFHTVHQLRLSEDKQSIEAIDVGIQAHVKGARYEPLVNVKGLPSWPSEPRYEQLAEGAEIERRQIDLENWWSDWQDVEQVTLRKGTDFDLCVLGISIGALPYICGELVSNAAKPAFSEMLAAVKTCETQAMQLWLRPTLNQLGVPGEPCILVPNKEPFDTWCDMTHLIVREDWGADSPVGHLAYFCSILPDDEPLPPQTDHGYPQRQWQRAFDNAALWCRTLAGGLWPKAVLPSDRNALNWHWLVDGKNCDGADRLKAQYIRAVTSPSERYVLSVPGSSLKRLRPEESGYSNLILTGDWVRTTISAGCLEAATMGGLLAGRAITKTEEPVMGDWYAPRITTERA
jgi:uncharacterized protein with NAD-binding domain and iron-sulfur cluster